MERKGLTLRGTLRNYSKILAPQPLPEPSRLKLSKLPLLVQIDVFKMLTRPEQYTLSKCSKKTSQLMKNSMPKNNDHEIWVKFNGSEVCYYLKSAESMLLIHQSPWKFFLEDHKYICDLFRAPLEVYAIWKDSKSFYVNFSTNCAVKRSNLLKYHFGISILHELPDLHTDQDLIIFDGQYTNCLKSGHSFLGARNLMLTSTKNYCPYRILSSFQGDHLLMEDVKFNTFYIQAFVDKWMRKKNDRLKSVIFKLDPEFIISDLKYEEFSGSDRKYQYDSLIKDYHKLPVGIFDCSGGYEVRRETDGKVATIKITEDYFMILVW